MSAIAGVASIDGRPVHPPVVRRMLEAVAHRGPDGMRVWSKGRIGFGHGLLQTTADPPSQTQPLVDGDLAITADVRLDNRDELLTQLGLVDGSTGDAALILAAYRRWEADCPSRLLGDFSFAVWDARRTALFCARDHFGVKPFYYSAGPDHFAFASEIKALLAMGNASRDVDEARIADFLASVVSDPSSTFYSGVMRLPAGHHLTVTPQGKKLQRYWRPEATSTRLERDTTEQFLDLFSTAVQCRLRTTCSVGAMLSGGLDSSSIACVSARISQQAARLPTFSLVSETPSARKERQSIAAVIAQGLFDPCYVAADGLAAFADFDQILAEQDGIFLAPGLILSRPIYRAAAERGVRVLLDGHGGDEVVSHGHGRLRELAAAGRWVQLWREVRSAADLYGTSAWKPLALHVGHFGPGARYVRPLGRAAMQALRRIRRLSGSRPSQIGFINPDLAARTDVAARHRAHRAALARCTTERERHLVTISDDLQPYALEVLDKLAAAAGVEARYPFWDKRLAEFCLALPSEAKLDNGWSRLILRRAMEGILPSPVQWRRDKNDFTPLLVRSMLGYSRPTLDDILVDNKADVGNYVDVQAVAAAYRRITDQPGAAEGSDVQAVWKTAALALWLRQLRTSSSNATALA